MIACFVKVSMRKSSRPIRYAGHPEDSLDLLARVADRSPRFQFGIATLLALTTAVAIVMSAISVRLMFRHL